jgi:hypothetical protein
MYAAATLTAIGFFLEQALEEDPDPARSFLYRKKMRTVVRATLEESVRRRTRVKKMLKGERSS